MSNTNRKHWFEADSRASCSSESLASPGPCWPPGCRPCPGPRLGGMAEQIPGRKILTAVRFGRCRKIGDRAGNREGYPLVLVSQSQRGWTECWCAATHTCSWSKEGKQSRKMHLEPRPRNPVPQDHNPDGFPVLPGSRHGDVYLVGWIVALEAWDSTCLVMTKLLEGSMKPDEHAPWRCRDAL